MNAILSTFAGIFSSGAGSAAGLALGTFTAIVTIDFIWKSLKTLLSEENQIILLVQSCVKYGMIYALIVGYSSLSNIFLESLTQAGLAIGGGSISSAAMKNPDFITTTGATNLQPILDAMKTNAASIKGIPTALMQFCIYIIGMLCYYIIAIQIFLCWLEWYIVGASAVIFFPFLANDNTKFMGEKAIGAIVATGVKLMVMAIVMSAIMPVLETNVIPTDPVNSSLWTALGSVLAMAFLAWQAPGMASGLLAGSPSIGGSEAITTAKNTGGNVAAGFGMGKSVGKAAVAAATNPTLQKAATTISHNMPGA